ncbi:hypothetical protein GCM10023176_01770 [Micromonospora coerulea]|uniref:Uncharacterized protein n=1 Tax=Micromonospora coerulea TaxID=47856 RepID=A0ABP8S4G9_9ACTN
MASTSARTGRRRGRRDGPATAGSTATGADFSEGSTTGTATTGHRTGGAVSSRPAGATPWGRPAASRGGVTVIVIDLGELRDDPVPQSAPRPLVGRRADGGFGLWRLP